MSRRYRPYALAWEAVFAADFTFEAVRRRAATLAVGLAQRGWSCVVAFDTRFMGQSFARAVCLDLQAGGAHALMAGSPAPLPAVHHALEQRVADVALVVTARNRPFFQNGLALLAPAGSGLSIEPAGHELVPAAFPPPAEQPGDPRPDLRAAYLDALRAALDLDLVRRVTMTIFVDAMGGTAAGAVGSLLGEGGQTRAIEINSAPDPLFGRAAPLPSEAGLGRLKKLVRESDSHLGLALSGDGTALAVVDKNGEQIDPFETALLLAGYLARQQRQRGLVVLPPPGPASPLAAGHRLAGWEEATGLKAELHPEPDLRLAELLDQDRPNLLLGASADGELLLSRYGNCPDALLAGMLIAEQVARSGGSLRSLIDAQREQLKPT